MGLLQSTEDTELVRRRGRWASHRVMEIYLQEMAASLYYISSLTTPTTRSCSLPQRFQTCCTELSLSQICGLWHLVPPIERQQTAMHLPDMGWDAAKNLRWKFLERLWQHGQMDASFRGDRKERLELLAAGVIGKLLPHGSQRLPPSSPFLRCCLLLSPACCQKPQMEIPAAPVAAWADGRILQQWQKGVL